MKLHNIKTFAVITIAATQLIALTSSNAADSEVYKSLQDYITKSLGKGWVASPNGADTRFRPKTMFVYLDDLQKRFEGTTLEKGWVPFSSGLSIYPDEYVTIQHEKVTLMTASADGSTKWAFLASIQKALGQLGLDASLSASLTNNWDLKFELEEAEKEWIWQDEMLLAQKITERTAERMSDVLKERYSKVPPTQTIIGALRVRGFSAAAESKSKDSAEAKANIAKLFLQLGLSWNHDKNRYESLKIADWQYIAFQARRARNGQITISSPSESSETPLDQTYVPVATYVP
jgi:hypothetical protein